MFPFTAFILLCATPLHKIPMYAHNIWALKVFICLSDQKYCDSPKHTESPLCYERYFIFPRQKRWHHWSHLMCALNIRWGRKGSIQEFSTLLQGSRPPLALPVFSGYTENQDWVEPATFTTTTTTESQLRVHWLETKQCMIAKPEPRLRPLGCSHRSSSAPPCTAQRFLPQKPKQVSSQETSLTTFPDESQHAPT